MRNMRNTLVVSLTLMAALLTSANVASAKSLNNRLDKLGGNKELYRKTKAMDPKNKFRVVQKRAVDRYWRLEIGGNYGMHAWSDPYVETSTWGGFADLHINPKWSVGARYNKHSNSLTSEGQRIYDNYNNGLAPTFQGVDLPESSTFGVISFYPMYGKLNLFDSAVAQFDVYLMGGAGQMELNSGPAQAWTAGGGVGVWMSNHFATRLEVRYQAYEDQIAQNVTRDQNMVVTTLSIGFML